MSVFSRLFQKDKPPIYFFKKIAIPALTPGEIKLYDAENTLRNYRKFAPYSNIQIINNSICRIDIAIDYSNAKILTILGKGTKALRNQPFYAFSIKNLDTVSTTAADEIFIELETIR